MNEKFTDNLARLAVERGVNVQKDEIVLVRGTVESAPLARKIAKYAYERGAKLVKVVYSDNVLDALDKQYQTIETLENPLPQDFDLLNYIAENNGSFISIICDDPNALANADDKKITAYRKARMKRLVTYYDHVMASRNKWTIVSYPHPDWAKLVFPDLDEKSAYDKLGEYIAKTTRVDCDDPLAEWTSHTQNLRRRFEKLNAAKVKSFHYKNSLGTDVTVGMPDGYVFAGGSESCYGTPFNANMPTEEIFSAPDCNHIDGVIKASMPLSYSGKIINDISLTLKNGKIIDYSASTNQDLLKGMIETDEGSHSLGEIALVPYDSPISSLNTLFYETLFDENASCHFAIGKAYPTCVKGGEDMSKEQLAKLGINDSDVHVDFMVGTRDLEITATLADGSVVKVFENGNFTPDFD